MQSPEGFYCRHRGVQTGDLVEVDQHKEYLFISRKDHMVEDRGYRIQLSEIEAVLPQPPLSAAGRSACLAPGTHREQDCGTRCEPGGDRPVRIRYSFNSALMFCSNI